MATIRYPQLNTGGAAPFDDASKLSQALNDGKSANAGAVGGLASADLLNRANHTGPLSASVAIPNANAGVILRAQGSGAPMRVWIDDSNSSAIAVKTEAAPASTLSDLSVPASAGVVLVGRHYGGNWRVVVNAAGALGLQPVPTPTSNDVHFGHAGIGIVQRGRTSQTRMMLYVDDSAGNSANVVNLAIEAA